MVLCSWMEKGSAHKSQTLAQGLLTTNQLMATKRKRQILLGTWLLVSWPCSSGLFCIHTHMDGTKWTQGLKKQKKKRRNRRKRERKGGGRGGRKGGGADLGRGPGEWRGNVMLLLLLQDDCFCCRTQFHSWELLSILGEKWSIQWGFVLRIQGDLKFGTMTYLCAFSLEGGWDCSDRHFLHDFMLTCRGKQVIQSKRDSYKMKVKMPIVFFCFSDLVGPSKMSMLFL